LSARQRSSSTNFNIQLLNLSVCFVGLPPRAFDRDFCEAHLPRPRSPRYQAANSASRSARCPLVNIANSRSVPPASKTFLNVNRYGTSLRPPRGFGIAASTSFGTGTGTAPSVRAYTCNSPFTATCVSLFRACTRHGPKMTKVLSTRFISFTGAGRGRPPHIPAANRLHASEKRKNPGGLGSVTAVPLQLDVMVSRKVQRCLKGTRRLTVAVPLRGAFSFHRPAGSGMTLSSAAGSARSSSARRVSVSV